jgi:predicted RNA methylase
MSKVTITPEVKSILECSVFGADRTPLEVVKTVLTYAMPDRGMRVLEPSAGDGAFADAIRSAGADVVCVENDSSTAEILMKKGHQVFGVDFLALEPFGNFDMVIMNPPYTKGQDAKHVTHALKFLRPEHPLFAIIPTSYEHNNTAAYRAFRSLIQQKGRVVEKFENHEFRSSGTDISTLLICITK